MRFCSGAPNCSVMLPHGVDRCPAHQRKAWHSSYPVKRVTGRPLTKLREALWDQQGGRCATCQRPILLSQMRRDHIIPLAEGTKDQPINDGCQGLCLACDKKKTEADSLRGRMRNA
jgi:5-methylcytosine-specific restriction endonuclease McrA